MTASLSLYADGGNEVLLEEWHIHASLAASQEDAGRLAESVRSTLRYIAAECAGRPFSCASSSFAIRVGGPADEAAGTWSGALRKILADTAPLFFPRAARPH